jgi:hypothetical protein
VEADQVMDQEVLKVAVKRLKLLNQELVEHTDLEILEVTVWVLLYMR